MEADQKCIPEVIRSVGTVKGYDQLRAEVLKIFPERTRVPESIRQRGVEWVRKFRYLVKAERVFQHIVIELGKIARLPSTSSMHDFYKDVAIMASENCYDDFIKSAAAAVKIISKLWKDYRSEILNASTGDEAKKIAVEFVGRSLSVVRRNLKNYDKFAKALNELKRAPCIDFNEPLFIIAGMPQVGKSTLVRRISSATPEVSPFPFTTKNVILGHLKIGFHKIQIMDTPGILDREIEEMNEIELKAVIAIRSTKSPIIFVVDPSKDSYYPFERQLNVLKSIINFVDKTNLFVVLNKVDKVDSNTLSDRLRTLENSGFTVIAAISALKGFGIPSFIGQLMKIVRSKWSIDIPERLVDSILLEIMSKNVTD